MFGRNVHRNERIRSDRSYTKFIVGTQLMFSLRLSTFESQKYLFTLKVSKLKCVQVKVSKCSFVRDFLMHLCKVDMGHVPQFKFARLERLDR